MYSQRITHKMSTVLILPIIDLDPSNKTCINSTLSFIEAQAKKVGITTAVVTFDQPLWYKALAVVKNEGLNIVCRLGGFHLLMCFLGSIGTLMSGSGLEDVLETVYAPKVIPHIFSGKAFSTAVRGHMLVHCSLLQLMFDELLDLGHVSVDDILKLSTIDPSDKFETSNSDSITILKAIDDWKKVNLMLELQVIGFSIWSTMTLLSLSFELRELAIGAFI